MVTELNGAITPTQVDEMRGIFDAIAAEPWFYDTVDSRQELSNIVMRYFRLGHVQKDDLLIVCIDAAKQRLSR